MLLLMMCGALKQSLKQKFDTAEVELAVHQGTWHVVCRTGDDDQLFSPTQARRQAELWGGYGHTELADEFRSAADEAERRKLRGRGWLGAWMPGPVAFIAVSMITIATVGGVAWRLLMREPAQTTVAVMPPESAPPAAPSATHEVAPTSQAMLAVPAQPAVKPIEEPEMVSLPGGAFAMGSNHDDSEMPVHRVAVKPFEIGKFPVTVREWNECVAAKICDYAPTGEDGAPVTNLSWSDAQQFLTWLRQVTQKSFRLPSEAEWEYAARGGTDTNFWWGDKLQDGMADCKGCGEPYDAAQPLKVGSLRANPFGVYDMGGDVDQWVEDCWHSSYQGAPVDGSPWSEEGCPSHVIRSGSWKNDPSYVRSASRDHYDTSIRYPTHGFRVARSL